MAMSAEHRSNFGKSDVSIRVKNYFYWDEKLKQTKKFLVDISLYPRVFHVG